MFLRFLRVGLLTAVAIASAACSSAVDTVQLEKNYLEPRHQAKLPSSTASLRVCADPNNMPFSNQKGEGFENKIADLLASDMHVSVENVWWAQRRGFFRNTLKSGACDVVMGVPDGFEMVANTQPYYRSTYVFVTRTDRDLDINSFDDPRLKTLKIGVQMVGDDGTNTPPAHALADRGVIDNIRGYSLYGDYSEASPPARIIDAVVLDDVDVAVVWGPLAGYFASRQSIPLTVTPVSAEDERPELPFAYDIAVGVRRGENDLKNRIDEILQRRHADIDKILDAYHLPRAVREGA